MDAFVGGREIGSSTLIVDNDLLFGDPFLKCFVRKMLNLGFCETHIYLYRFDPSHLLDGIDASLSKVKIHDFSSNNMGWESDSGGFEFPKVTENMVVIVDDLSRLIDLADCNKVCRLLNRFNQEFKESKFASIIRGDLHSNMTMKSLEHSCMTWIVLEASQMLHVYAKATTILKKKKCSTKKFVEAILISDRYEVKFNKLIPEKSLQHAKKEDPHSNLTFNVKLNSNEMEARNNLVLPYLAAREVRVAKTSGKIEYIPDDFDDLDDEDPDDDLDI